MLIKLPYSVSFQSDATGTLWSISMENGRPPTVCSDPLLPTNITSSVIDQSPKDKTGSHSLLWSWNCLTQSAFKVTSKHSSLPPLETAGPLLCVRTPFGPLGQSAAWCTGPGMCRTEDRRSVKTAGRTSGPPRKWCHFRCWSGDRLPGEKRGEYLLLRGFSHKDVCVFMYVCITLLLCVPVPWCTRPFEPQSHCVTLTLDINPMLSLTMSLGQERDGSSTPCVLVTFCNPNPKFLPYAWNWDTMGLAQIRLQKIGWRSVYKNSSEMAKKCWLYLDIFSCVKINVFRSFFAFRLEMHVKCNNQYKTGAEREIFWDSWCCLSAWVSAFWARCMKVKWGVTLFMCWL